MRQTSGAATLTLASHRQDFLDSRIYTKAGASLQETFAAYIDGLGFQFDHIVAETKTHIDANAIERGLIDRGESVFNAAGQLRPEFLRRVLPGRADMYLQPAAEIDVAAMILLKEGINEWMDQAYPAPLNMLFGREIRPAFAAYGLLGADVYVHPYGYQVRRLAEGIFFPSASSRPYSRVIEADPSDTHDGDLVIVQDRFAGENFAHILYDWITRLGHFLESGLDASRAKFVMGGARQPFVEMLIEAFCRCYGVAADQFYFPERGHTIRPSGRTFWFSDQVDRYMHPAQMAHPRSVDIVRKVSACIPISGVSNPRVFISRTDAGRRRLLNEEQIWRQLDRHGFEFVRLSDHSLEHQVAIIRGADHIVSPHGMGLTLASLSARQPSVTELHHPRRGTDAYAFMAKAMAFPYRYVLGTDREDAYDDFELDPADLLAADIGEGLRWWKGASFRAPENLLPCSASFASGWYGGKAAEPTPQAEVPPVYAGNVVIRHTRTDSEDSNVGAWIGITVEPSQVYTASCWIWLRNDLKVWGVVLSIGEWGPQIRRTADLAKRDCWQRLSVTATTPAASSQCNVVLRVDAPAGGVVHSTCWQVEKGPCTNDYVPTHC